jgi:hypothetical protein
METTDPRTRTVEQFEVQSLHRYFARAATMLRELAEEIERTERGLDRIGQPGYNSYSQIAADVQHAVATWHMNAHLEQIPLAAADADMARVKGE